MSICACLYMDIPKKIRIWGEGHLELDNPYRIIGDQLFSLIPEDKFTSMIQHDMIQHDRSSSTNPIILSLVTIFQYQEYIPDRTATLWVKTRLDWKYALHIPLYDNGFHHSDLYNFRERLLACGKEFFIFDQLLKRIESFGFLRKRSYQRTDSTHVLAVVHLLSRLENLTEGLRVALKAIEKTDAVFYKAKLPTLYREHWSKPPGEAHQRLLSDYQITDNERKEALEDVGQDIYWFLGFLKRNNASFLSLPELEALQTLFSCNFTIQAQEVYYKKKATESRVPSVAVAGK